MNSALSISDDRLMRQIALGDSNAFEELYRRHVRAALLVARRQGASPELAEEVVQEAFVSLWRRSTQFQPHRGSVSAWLATIVRNRVTDAWRRAGARPSQVPEESAPEAAALADVDPAEQMAVRELLSTLPDEQRSALVLSYFGGLTHEQIADACGWPLGTVKGRLRLGLERMRLTMAAA
ncbi:MAG: RNA polymerase sigma factor [Solirubrobacteraceae bacterium]